MRLASILQFFLGFLMGIALLASAGGATAYYFFTRLSSTPQKPEFPIATVTPPPKPVEIPVDPPTIEEDAVAASEEPTESESASAETVAEPDDPEEEDEPETLQDRFGENAQRVRVTWSSGLSLRANPSGQSPRVGGVYYNDELVLLETSSDGRWQKVHVPSTGQEAWVKAGNTASIN